MTPPALPDEDLQRASHNLQRLCDFLAIHTAPPMSGGGRRQVSRLFDAAVELCQRLQPVLAANGASPPRPQPVAPAAEARALDPTRADRFADFLAQLNGWFAAREEAGASAAGVESLQAMYGSLVTIRTATSALLDRIDGGATAAAPAPAAVPEAAAEPSPPPPPEPSGLPPAQPRSDRQLLLVDLDERPLLVEFRDKIELTATATESLDEFLAEHGLELSAYDRRKLDDKVRRWIEATPEGQALVLKVGGLRGALEPFPSYVPRERVKDAIEKLRGYA